MAEERELIARVVSQKGTCAAGHRVGDEFTVGDSTPGGMCSWAFYSMFPFATALQFGGRFPWRDDPDTVALACPDASNPVVFELRRAR